MRSAYGQTPTRYELNRLVRNVLTRHGANMELISISCTARVVYLTGQITKAIRPDYKASEIENIFREIAKIQAVRSIYANLDNWIVSAVKSTGEWLINRKGASPYYQREMIPVSRFSKYKKEKKEQTSSDTSDDKKE